MSKIKLIYGTLSLFLLVCSVKAFSAQVDRNYLYAIRYNSAGQVTGEISPDGSAAQGHMAVRINYDDAGRVKSKESGALRSFPSELVDPLNWENEAGFEILSGIHYDYDNYGRIVAIRKSGESGDVYSLIQKSYNRRGLLECNTVRMNPDSYSSLPSACELGLQGQFGPDRITKYEYDYLGQVEKTTRAYGIPEYAAVETNTYEGNQLTAQTDANNNRTDYEYDGYVRLHKRIYPGATAGAFRRYNQYFYSDTGNIVKEKKRKEISV